MRPIYLLLTSLTFLLAACSNEPPIEKAIIGTWVQETPVSMTSGTLQTTTSDTILRIEKDGDVDLTRRLDVRGQGLPDAGVSVNVELSGKWALVGGSFEQRQDRALITPRTPDAEALKWADLFQEQAESSGPSLKSIVSVDRQRLILQDKETGATDVYRRK